MNNIRNIRGIRNNNPFNIKRSRHPWVGKTTFDNEKVFEVFTNMEFGLRAGIKLLVTYIERGYNTPRKIINRFAPHSENPTSNYLWFVCRNNTYTPWIGEDDVISLPRDYEKFLYLCYRILEFETSLPSDKFHCYGMSREFLDNIVKKFNLIKF